LQWAGKTEHTSFEVPTVSLHVHERIDPRTIIEAVRRGNGEEDRQITLFDMQEQNPPLREAIEFYKHSHGWSNRLVAGDSLLVMNSLIEKEGLAGKVQMIYIDPPYGIKYGSNFQPFVNKRDVKDGKDEDLTAEPEQIRAFRDTWELGIHSYLTYLRDRLLLAQELLTESGSVFVQISDENVHHVREIMDEVFGSENFLSIIAFQKTGYLGGNYLDNTYDYLIFYSKNKQNLKFNKLFQERDAFALARFNYLEKKDGTSIRLNQDQIAGKEIIPEGRRWQDTSLLSDGETKGESSLPFEFEGEIFKPNPGKHWSTGVEGLKRLANNGKLIKLGKNLRYKYYVDDNPLRPINTRWDGMMIGTGLNYVVETSSKVIERCILLTTDPGDLVFDPTCGSGTTAYVAEQWGRRWITCDTSRVASDPGQAAPDDRCL
jgi:adenine-specific DNA-methyltransferase